MSSRCCSIDEAGPNKLVQTGAKDVVNCRRRWTGYQLLDVDAIKKSRILEGLSVYTQALTRNRCLLTIALIRLLVHSTIMFGNARSRSRAVRS